MMAKDSANTVARHRVLKNVTHPERGLVQPEDEDPFVDLSHLDEDQVKTLVDRGVVAPAAQRARRAKPQTEPLASLAGPFTEEVPDTESGEGELDDDEDN